MIPYEEWEVFFPDKHLEIRRNPEETEDYRLLLKTTGKNLSFSKKQIRPIAMCPVEEGNKRIQEIIEQQYSPRGTERFLEKTHLNLPYLNATITKTYFLVESEDRLVKLFNVDTEKFFKDLNKDRKNIQPHIRRSLKI